MKVILLGYMASGKSTVGKKLAKKLFLPFIDLDDYIEKKEKKSISTLFKEKGEIYFRRIEHKYLKELLNAKEDFVLSLGGGTPCYAGNMELIKKSEAIAIYLKASIKTITGRLLSAKRRRPLVANIDEDKIAEFVAKHLFERSEFYEQATYKVIIDDKTVDEIITEIRILLH